MAKASGIAQFSEGRSDVHRVSPKLLVIKQGWNMRDETPELLEHIDELAKSIAKIGVKKPIEVKMEDGQMVVKEGHCRTRAAMRAIEVYNADLKTVPVIPSDRYASEEDLILNQIIGNSGKPFTTMEQAKIFKKLLDMGYSQTDIAEKTGKTSGRISQILGLLTMPVAVQTMVSNGSVSPSLAQATVKAADTPAIASKALQEAVDKAAGQGRAKVKPADIVAPEVSNGPRMTFKSCFDDSEIDSENANETGYVDIRMPLDNFEFIRQALKL